MNLFRADDNASRALRQLAELLFRQAQLFGRLGIDQGISREQVQHAVIRTGPVLSMLQTLELTSSLRFEDEFRLPFTYNRASWSPERPVGGYTSDPSAPLPSEVLSSLILAWYVDDEGHRKINVPAEDPELTSTGHESSLVERLVRSALVVMSSGGFESGLDYLLDLAWAGFILNTRPLTDAIGMLLVGRCQSDSDSELVRSFYAGKSPQTNEEALEFDISYSWLRIQSLGHWWYRSSPLIIDNVAFDVNDGKMQPYLLRLLENTLARVDDVRSAESYDEWVAGQIMLAGHIRVVTNLVDALSLAISLPVQALLSQLEEMLADVGALTDALSVQYGVPSYYADESFGFLLHVAGQYKKTLGDSWVDRFFTERLLVPHALRSRLLPNFETPDRIPQWDSISWEAAHPFCLALRQQDPAVVVSKSSETSLELISVSEPVVPAMFSRKSGLDFRDLLDTETTRDWVERLGADSEIVVWLLRRAHRTNHQYGLPVLHDIDAAEVAAQDGAVLRLRDDVSALVGDYLRDCAGELLAGVELAMQKTATANFAESVNVLQALLEAYPWSSTVYQELAIATDEGGDPASALDFIIRALVLDPRQSVPWQSLGVILQRLQASAEGLIAAEIGQMTAQIEHKYVLG